MNVSKLALLVVAACAAWSSPLAGQAVTPGQTVTSGRLARSTTPVNHGYMRLWRDLTLWCRSDRGVSSTFGGSVGAWLDLSRNGHHLGQENLTMAPRLEQLGGAGFPELSFDGFDVLELEGALPSGSYTVALAFRLAESSGGGNVLEGSSYALRLNPAFGVEVEQSGNTLVSAGALSAGVPHLLIVTHNATNGTTRVYLDGALQGTGLLPANTNTALSVGGLDGTFQGGLSEIMVFESELSPMLLGLVYQYLARRYFNGPQLTPVEFDALPQNSELIPREVLLGTGSIPVSGTVSEPGFTTIIAYLYRAGQLFGLDSAALVYSGGEASFSLDLSILAELEEYELLVTLLSPGNPPAIVAQREHLCCGDVFIVAGQSNGLAADVGAELLGNNNQSNWIRSFGSVSEIPAESVGDYHWDLAGALDFDGHAFVGQWALRLGAEIVDATDVPVAFINGCMGSTAIAEHQRDMVSATDPNTIYGRLLARAREAKVDDDIRAMLWYQGEGDTGLAGGWAPSFDTLRMDWLLDYPLIERIFMFQIREGCGPLNGGIREIQRGMKNLYSNVELMSTSALPTHNGCHFLFDGYDRLGLDISRQVLRDLYGSGLTAEIDPPQLVSAAWLGSGNDTIRLTFENLSDALIWETGTEQFVYFDDFSVFVTGVQVAGNVIDLTLGTSAPQLNLISYVGHAFDGPALTNGGGVGALTFFAVPIQ